MSEGTIPISASGTGNVTILSGVSGQVIQILGIFFQCNVASNVTIKSGTADLTGAMNFTSGGQMNLPYNGNPYLTTNDGDDLIFHFGGLTGQAGGFLIYNQL